MTVSDVRLEEEAQTRYLTYALSVVNSRALPDVRDGLKPVQRRILYAMLNNLSLTPDHHHRKCAAVVGEVLGRYHPHGDSACYEALVRMAQDFSLRYPLIDGQGNFGSLDGDGAAAYRYTEARLTKFATEVIGDIGQETVAERLNFDQTITEPIVLPSRVPNLLVNGASGIAVGMATAIPPHNLNEVIKGLLLLIEDPEVTDGKIFSAIKGPDFPTGCLIMNSNQELREIYKTGRGAVRMRGDYKRETGARGREYIVVTSIPYGVDKSSIVEKIADLIMGKKVPQLVDVRDESTDEVRVVLELASLGNEKSEEGVEKNVERVMAYLYKNTPLQTNFNVNLTALVPTKNPMSGKPLLLPLRQILTEFIDFRLQVTRCKLQYEKSKLEERIHLLEGLMKIIDIIPKVIEIVRKSDGRSDAAQKLQDKFDLSEKQAFFIVDLRVYQLSRTNVAEVEAELKEKLARVKEINRILGSEKALRGVISEDLQRVSEEFGDDRRSKILGEVEEVQIDEAEYVQHEDVFALITGDGWMKRVRNTNDPSTTRLREGDTLAYAIPCNTRDSLALLTSFGNLFVCKVYDLVSTAGFGEPVQKMFKFQDGESIIAAFGTPADQAGAEPPELFLASERGLGFRMKVEIAQETKKNGKRVAKVADGDSLLGAIKISGDSLVLVSRQGYVLSFLLKEVPLLTGPGKGVILMKLPKDDRLAGVALGRRSNTVVVELSKGGDKEIPISSLTIGERARRGEKIIQRNTPVMKVSIPAQTKETSKN